MKIIGYIAATVAALGFASAGLADLDASNDASSKDFSVQFANGSASKWYYITVKQTVGDTQAAIKPQGIEPAPCTTTDKPLSFKAAPDGSLVDFKVSVCKSADGTSCTEVGHVMTKVVDGYYVPPSLTVAVDAFPESGKCDPDSAEPGS